MHHVITDGMVCAAVIQRLAHVLGQDKCSKFIESSARLSVRDGRLCVAAPNAFVADWLARRYHDAIAGALREETGDPGAAVDIVVDTEAFHAAGVNERAVADAAAAPARTEAAPQRRVGRSTRRASAAPFRLRRLEDFIVGASNRLAYNAAIALADAADGHFGPLYIHGPCGVGKTHLLQGVAERIRRTRPGARVRYTTAESFTNGFIASLHAGRLEEFRRAFRDLDALCIDDVHFLSNKGATQNEFLHTFDAIELTGARIVLASDEHPRHILKLSEKLVSRFTAGMVVGVERPERELRVRIARALFERRGLKIEEAAARLVADRCPDSVRDVEGAVTRIDALHRLVGSGESTGGRIGVLAVERALGGTGAALPLRPVSVARIIHVVCDALRVDPSDVLGSSRHKRVVFARALAAHLARSMTTLSFPEIAREMHRPNHSTIITACNRVAKQLERDERCDHGVVPGEHAPLLSDFVDTLRRRASHADAA